MSHGLTVPAPVSAVSSPLDEARFIAGEPRSDGAAITRFTNRARIVRRRLRTAPSPPESSIPKWPMLFDNAKKRLYEKLKGKSLFHFTDSRNVPSIKTHGLLSLAELRRRELAPAAFGGNELSHALDVQRGIDEYVHLSFTPSHPMIHACRQDGRIESVTQLKVSPEVILSYGVRYTLDIANKNDVPILKARDVVETMDFDAIYQWLDWRTQEGKARRKAVERYEVLVPKLVGLKYLKF